LRKRDRRLDLEVRLPRRATEMRKGLLDRTPARTITIVTKGWALRCGQSDPSSTAFRVSCYHGSPTSWYFVGTCSRAATIRCLTLQQLDRFLNSIRKKNTLILGENWANLMSYTEARSHFEKARLNTVDKGVIDMLDGLKHLSHAIEEDLRSLEQSIRNIRDVQSSKQIPGSFT